MALEVVGRDEELSTISEFLGRPALRPGPSAIALEGDAGIGKSTVWRVAVDAARSRGVRVLESRPAESERELAHAGLGDLLDGALADVLPALPAPRRRALEIALLVEDADGPPLEPRALGVAVRNALELLAEDGVLIAIDDLQWLDPSSASALAFALRRLPNANLRLVWARRVVGGARPSPVEEALEPDRIQRLRIGPLSVGAIHRLLREQLSRSVPRPTLLRLHETSAGNPFYALELARALGPDGTIRDPTEPLPVPESLEELVSARLAGFAGATRDALVLASAHARLAVADLAGIGIDRDALQPALDDRVLELEHGLVRFTHPLLGSVLYTGLGAAERQRAHHSLAGLTTDPLARARHLALSTDTPDRELAATLEEASRAAEAQGAPIVAAELGEHALRLTPADDGADANRRALAAARAHLAAGEVERGRLLAGELVERGSPGHARAEALTVLAEAGFEEPRGAILLLREALLEPGVQPALQASIHGRLSLLVRFTEGLEQAEHHARASVELADGLGDPAVRAAGLASLALIRFNAAKGGALELAEQAFSLAPGLSTEADTDTAFALVHILVWSFELERARDLVERLYRDWSERDERLAAYALWYLALVDLRAGRLSRAAEHADRAQSLSAQYAREGLESPQSVLPAALVAAHRGELGRARELAELCCRLAELHGARLSAPPALLAVVELWSGDPEAAAARFAAAEPQPDIADGADPGMTWWRAEQVEALLELGRIEEAGQRLDAWEADATRLGRGWVLAHATRCRGLAAAATGDVERALALLGEAVEHHGAVGDPFGRARALLALGVARRRARQKRAAREPIEAARAAFAEIGAAGWAERAQNELGRIGGRTRVEGLTPAERRVAELVAQGRTNAEVAATLFLAERTVASHLTSIYAKVGVRSRTELSRRLG